MVGLLVMGGCLIKYFDYSFSFEHIASSIWQENETFAHFQVVDWLEMANYPNTPTGILNKFHDGISSMLNIPPLIRFHDSH